jgi:hypothetical protein
VAIDVLSKAANDDINTEKERGGVGRREEHVIYKHEGVRRVRMS